MATVASYETTTETNTSSLSITKPTGLAEGDIMLAVIVEADTGNPPSTPSGWTSLGSSQSTGSAGDRTAAFFVKEADASDEAASTFSFAPSTGTQYIGGALMRLADASGDLSQFDLDSQVNFDSSTNPTISISVTPPGTNHLLVAFTSAGLLSTTYSMGDPNISGTDPTWVEMLEVGDGSQRYGLFYGEVSADTAITSLQPNFGTRGSLTDDAVALLSYGDRVDADAAVTFFSTTSTTFTQTATADTITNAITLIEATAEVNQQSGKATSPTQWTNEAEESTTWTNEQL